MKRFDAAKFAFLLAVASLLTPRFAWANDFVGMPLVGASSSPDQLLVGGRVSVSDITGLTGEGSEFIGAHTGLVLGVGNQQQVLRWSADATFHFPIPELGGADFYAFGGFSLAATTVNGCGVFGQNCSFTAMGIEAGVGMTVPLQGDAQGVDVAATLGFGGLPAAMITVGYVVALPDG